MTVPYRCRDIGYGIERGEIYPTPLGPPDHVGKRPYTDTQGRTLYLFDDEVRDPRTSDCFWCSATGVRLRTIGTAVGIELACDEHYYTQKGFDFPDGTSDTVKEILVDALRLPWRLEISWGNRSTGVADRRQAGYVVERNGQAMLNPYQNFANYYSLEPDKIVKIRHSNKSAGGVLFQAPELDMGELMKAEIGLRAMAKRLLTNGSENNDG